MSPCVGAISSCSAPLQITSVINPALDKYFPVDSGVRIIAEPGRYYVASAFTLAVNIIAKKLVLREQAGSDGEWGAQGWASSRGMCAQAVLSSSVPQMRRMRASRPSCIT